MEFLADPQVWISLLTLTLLEIVLGIDNIIFISILAGKLPYEKQDKARKLGLTLALGTRLLLLAGIAYMAKLTTPLFSLAGFAVSGRDLILLGGGLFLIAKSTFEIHEKLEGTEEHTTARPVTSFTKVIIQIMLLDIVFSLDSVITAVGMASQLWIMVTAVVIAMGVMLVFSGVISDFVHKHPTLKMLALSFLILIGVSLLAEGLHQHISKGYIYFAMAFSCAVEMVNLKLRAKSSPSVERREAIKE